MAENSPALKQNSKNIQFTPENKNINVLNLKVVRRDGSITPFKSEKISNRL